MYLKQFERSESALSLAVDPLYCYVDGAYQESYLSLRYGIRLASGLLVVTGESGVGKTTLINLVDRSDPNMRMALIASQGHDFSSLLQLFSAALGLKEVSPESRSMLREIRRYLVEQLKNDCVVALVLDDAHELDVETLQGLKSLLRLQSSGKSLLRVILAGRPELEINLENPVLKPLKQRVALWCRIAPLSSGEVATYMDQRLATAGHRLKELFQPAAVMRVAAYSRGVPGLINTIGDKALYLASRRAQERVMAENVDEAWLALRQNGETDFEVAALLSELRIHCESPVATSQSSTQPADQEPEPYRATERSPGLRDRLQQLPPLRRLQGLAARWTRQTAVTIALIALAAVLATLYGQRNKQGNEKSAESYGTATLPTPATTPPEPRPNFAMTKQAEEVQQPSISQQAADEKPVNETLPTEITTPLETNRKPEANRPAATVYVHTSRQVDLAILDEIGEVLRENGYNVQETRLARNGTRGDVRFFFGGDQYAAEKVKALVQTELGKRGYAVPLQILQRDGKKFQFAAPGNIEVWLPPLHHSQASGQG